MAFPLIFFYKRMTRLTAIQRAKLQLYGSCGSEGLDLNREALMLVQEES